MRRREFIALVGGAMALAPLAARAQQPGTPIVGFLDTASPGPTAPFLAAFRQGLLESGFVEGQNVLVEYRWGNNDNERLPTLAAGPASSGCDRGVKPAVRPCGQSSDQVHTSCLWDRRRSGGAWTCREPEPSGRQCHRRNSPKHRGLRKTATIAARIDPHS